MRVLTLLLCSLGALAATRVPGFAQETGAPVYFPGTNSYYQLRVEDTPVYWLVARKNAASQSLKGVRGRLAVIQDPDLHKFIKKKFKSRRAIWIGLRYWCGTRSLQWVTGEKHSPGMFNPWARQWFRTARTMCGSGTATKTGSFMPVYYLPHGDGFLWQASGPAKGFKSYLVEYPTGAP